MANVSAPYNFVPLNKEVFFPPWANLVNHDIPFKDGLSGQIELEITAETPIFIRKPYEDGDEYYLDKKKNRISKEFCHIKEKDKNGNVNKRYYIPGSSIRNMLRSVVEIMGFGKLNKSDFSNRRYGVRDFNNTDVYTLLDETENIRIGYLTSNEDDNYIIYDKGVPVRVNQGKICYTKDEKTLCLKDLFDSENMDSNAIKTNHKGKRVLKSDAKTATYKYLETNTIFKSAEGGYVFTGQPSFNNITKGKHNEFIIEKLEKENDTKIIVTKEQFEDFKFIYGDYEGSNNISKDWKMWKEKLAKGEAIPVFFRLNENNLLEDFGLAFLYKMAYENRIEKGVYNVQRDYSSGNYDLAELLFGSINNNSKLKGRIQINHAFASKAQSIGEYKIALASPKASFYPFYIEQNIDENSKDYKIKGKYNTYNNSFVKIKGRKRYPLHSLNLPNKKEQQKTPNNIATFIKPLKANTTFNNTKLTFHNLLPVELGALLSAITFHNNTNCRHNIGTAKPFGLGEISINIKKITLNYNNNIETNKTDDNITQVINYYMSLFEKSISKKIENWTNSIQLKELFTMSSIKVKNKFVNYDYMKLFDFPKIKNEKKALPTYSKMINYNEILKPLASNIKTDLDLNEKEKLSHLLTKINNKINVLKHQKYNNNNNNNNVEYILNDGDYIGTVKFFNEARGFGFITEKTTKKEFFIHKSNLCEVIKENDLVIFNIIKGRKKGQKAANNVEIFDKNNNKHIKQN